MKCQRCESTAVADITAKCSDCCFVRLGEKERQGYLSTGLGVGGGDYVEFTWCLHCGQIQGRAFPVLREAIEAAFEEEEEE